MSFNVTAFNAFRNDDFEGKPDDEIKETGVMSDLTDFADQEIAEADANEQE